MVVDQYQARCESGGRNFDEFELSGSRALDDLLHAEFLSM
jgi:hypothetical protein